jgi:hypothetical protein
MVVVEDEDDCLLAKGEAEATRRGGAVTGAKASVSSKKTVVERKARQSGSFMFVCRLNELKIDRYHIFPSITADAASKRSREDLGWE